MKHRDKESTRLRLVFEESHLTIEHARIGERGEIDALLVSCATPDTLSRVAALFNWFTGPVDVLFEGAPTADDVAALNLPQDSTCTRWDSEELRAQEEELGGRQGDFLAKKTNLEQLSGELGARFKALPLGTRIVDQIRASLHYSVPLAEERARVAALIVANNDMGTCLEAERNRLTGVGRQMLGRAILKACQANETVGEHVTVVAIASREYWQGGEVVEHIANADRDLTFAFAQPSDT